MPRGESQTPKEALTPPSAPLSPKAQTAEQRAETQALRLELTSIKELEALFKDAKKRFLETHTEEDRQSAVLLHKELKERIASLRDKINPFERVISVREQYESQVTILNTVGILETFTTGEHTGEQGIIGIDGKEYPIPTYQDISRRMIDKREVLKTKIEQGFTKLILVPFGMPIDTLIEKYKQTLQRHFDEGKLFYTKADPDDPDEEQVLIPKLHAEGPLYVWDQYQGGDMIDPATNTSKLVYDPQEFSPDHKGKTKQDLITINGGWQILLLENMPNIPRQGKVKTQGGRTQIDTKGNTITAYMEAGKIIPSPQEYLSAIITESSNPASPYFQEQGMTPEEQMMYALTYLEETNQVIDDWQGNGSLSYQIRAYFPAFGCVPIACWNRDAGRAYLSWDDRGYRRGNYGLRSAVGV
ncbi:MAG: hypothetical protein AAB018_03225 [Actinomycetota bacterium]